MSCLSKPVRRTLLRALPWLLCGIGLVACGNEAAEQQAKAAAAARAESAAAQMLANLDQSIDDGRPDLARAFAEDLIARYPDTAAARSVQPRLAELRSAADAAEEQRRLEGLWTYHAVDDAEAGGIVHTAFIYARSAGPGMPTVRLVLRRHPAWGQSAYLLITEGDFACQTTCTMQLVADGGEPVPMKISRAEGNVPPSVFIDADAELIGHLQEAALIELRIALAPSRETAFEFEVGGLDISKLGPETSGGTPQAAKRAPSPPAS